MLKDSQLAAKPLITSQFPSFPAMRHSQISTVSLPGQLHKLLMRSDGKIPTVQLEGIKAFFDRMVNAVNRAANGATTHSKALDEVSGEFCLALRHILHANARVWLLSPETDDDGEMTGRTELRFMSATCGIAAQQSFIVEKGDDSNELFKCIAQGKAFAYPKLSENQFIGRDEGALSMLRGERHLEQLVILPIDWIGGGRKQTLGIVALDFGTEDERGGKDLMSGLLVEAESGSGKEWRKNTALKALVFAAGWAAFEITKIGDAEQGVFAWKAAAAEYSAQLEKLNRALNEFYSSKMGEDDLCRLRGAHGEVAAALEIISNSKNLIVEKVPFYDVIEAAVGKAGLHEGAEVFYGGLLAKPPPRHPDDRSWGLDSEGQMRKYPTEPIAKTGLFYSGRAKLLSESVAEALMGMRKSGAESIGVTGIFAELKASNENGREAYFVIEAYDRNSGGASAAPDRIAMAELHQALKSGRADYGSWTDAAAEISGKIYCEPGAPNRAHEFFRKMEDEGLHPQELPESMAAAHAGFVLSGGQSFCFADGDGNVKYVFAYVRNTRTN